MKVRPLVSACLISWKRPKNIELIVQHLTQFDFIDEIIIWNNDPTQVLRFSGGRIRVIDAKNNLCCYGRYVAAQQAKNYHIYVQDDDALVKDIASLYDQFLINTANLIHGLSSWHYTQRERYFYGPYQMSYLGWGAFFTADKLKVFETVPLSMFDSWLFYREADKFFTILLEAHHTTILLEPNGLPGHSEPDQALWKQPEHNLMSSMAIRKALQLLRNKRYPTLPVTFHVVIYCYQNGNNLRETVMSVLHSDVDYELTIVDDCSTDNTEEVVALLVQEYHWIRYQRNPVRRGVSASRNCAIMNVDSKFVVSLNANDCLGPDYLYEAYKILKSGADVANPDALIFGTVEERWRAPESTSLVELLHHNSIHYCSVFFRENWLKVGGFDESIPYWEDYDFWIRVLAGGALVRRVPGDHFFYRQENPSLAVGTQQSNEDILLYIRNKHLDLYEKHR